MKRLLLKGILASGVWVALSLPLFAQTTDTADQAGIRQVMMKTWDKPQARLDVGPITVLADHAVAGWTQDGRGGRALLTRKSDGRWQVAACAGDGLKEVKTLELTGMPPATAREMARMIAKAEASVTPQRRALFSTFDGMVRMDSAGSHPPHAPGEKH